MRSAWLLQPDKKMQQHFDDDLMLCLALKLPDNTDLPKQECLRVPAADEMKRDGTRQVSYLKFPLKAGQDALQSVR